MHAEIKSLIARTLRKLTCSTAGLAIALAVVVALAAGACTPNSQSPEQPVPVPDQIVIDQGPEQPVPVQVPVQIVIDQGPIRVNDCFGGILSDYPIHCGFLQVAHNGGVFEIESIYQGGKALFVFLTQSDELTTQQEDTLRNVAHAKLSDGNWEGCNRERYYRFGCYLGVVSLRNSLEFWLPPMADFEQIILISSGGVTEGRPVYYDKLWPAVAESTERDQGSRVTTRSDWSQLDLSDIDLTNLPPVDCLRTRRIERSACNWWDRHPDLGIAGLASGGGPTLYVQIKATTDREAKVAAAKAAIIAAYSDENEDTVVVVPVNYDFADLWRYREILARFEHSDANTLGIRSPEYVTNDWPYSDAVAVYPVAGIQPIADGEFAQVRATIKISALKLNETLAALPQLLPQLGIPVDAVGGGDSY